MIFVPEWAYVGISRHILYSLFVIHYSLFIEPPTAVFHSSSPFLLCTLPVTATSIFLGISFAPTAASFSAADGTMTVLPENIPFTAISLHSFALIALTPNVQFATLFSLYTISVAFFMPTIALTNSVAFNALVKANMDTVKDFPPIRVFGTVGFIATMWCIDLLGFQATPWQFVVSGGLSLLLAGYSLTLPACEIKKTEGSVDLVEALGLKAFTLFKQKKMAEFQEIVM